MDLSKIFEELAMTTHESPKLQQIFQSLPPDVRYVIQSNDSLKLRSLLGGGEFFSDSLKVTTK